MHSFDSEIPSDGFRLLPSSSSFNLGRVQRACKAAEPKTSLLDLKLHKFGGKREKGASSKASPDDFDVETEFHFELFFSH